MYKTNNIYRKVLRPFYKSKEKIASAGAFLSESFSYFPVIKTFNQSLQKIKAQNKFSDIYKNMKSLR